MAKTKNIIDAIRAELASDPELAGMVEQEAVNADIALQVRNLREAAGLVQKELAQKAGTHQSVISRIEDSDYEGHSVSLLRRVAAALGKKLCVKFCSEEEKKRLLFASTNSEVQIIVAPAPVGQFAPASGQLVHFYLGQSLAETQTKIPSGTMLAVGRHLVGG
jgi:transcriptional regulator with XRE-family HTH domain